MLEKVDPRAGDGPERTAFFLAGDQAGGFRLVQEKAAVDPAELAVRVGRARQLEQQLDPCASQVDVQVLLDPVAGQHRCDQGKMPEHLVRQRLREGPFS